jgi:hypothetical protein
MSGKKWKYSLMKKIHNSEENPLKKTKKEKASHSPNIKKIIM